MNHRLKESNYQELLLWLLGRRRRFRVTGLSMSPLLKPGEEILIDQRAYRRLPPEIGDLVVARHPEDRDLQLVKWVAAVREDGSCFLLGDNPSASTDSRSFGIVSLKLILGRVTSRFP